VKYVVTSRERQKQRDVKTIVPGRLVRPTVATHVRVFNAAEANEIIEAALGELLPPTWVLYHLAPSGVADRSKPSTDDLMIAALSLQHHGVAELSQRRGATTSNGTATEYLIRRRTIAARC
jgi:hypothetical protein